MPLLSKNPKQIHDGYKEAVVDSLLNNLSARLSGRGEFYSIIYGNKPAAVLMSEFIVPMPVDERVGDEEADPIQISAHGLDFQISTESSEDKIAVSVTGAVYVRIIPTFEEVGPEGRLEITFPPTKAVEQALRSQVKAALASLSAELGGRAHPDWPARSYAARKAVYASVGVPFDNTMDRTSGDAIEGSGPVEGLKGEAGRIATVDGEAEGPLPGASVGSTGDGTGALMDESKPPIELRYRDGMPDSLAEPVALPQKWFRLALTLPSFEFSPHTAESDAKVATDALNASIEAQISAWAASTEEPAGGQLWGYRRGMPVRPSHIRNWPQYLTDIRNSQLQIVVPRMELRWVVQALVDPSNASRTSVHVALENWTLPLNKANHKEIEPSFFQVTVSADVPSASHRFLRLDRVKPSYRYNEYLQYPALGFNGGVILTKEGQMHRLTSTWAPRYVLPRIIPTNRGVELNIENLAEADSVEGVKPIVAAYEKWLIEVASYPVDRGLDGADAAEMKEREQGKLLKDIASWKAELGAIRCGIAILEESRAHWSGPGVQKSRMGIPFEAWVSMNLAMARVAKSKGYNEWRLFQLAFILASIPAFATRMPEFHKFYTNEVAQHANAVTLLYFATGGGKSEAFLGLLVFVLLLDRLRGKHRGVSALMRYPLRLLTLQQARRTFAAMGAAETVRHTRSHPGEPFSLGFWVGAANTPNWHSDEAYNEVPTDVATAVDQERTCRTTQPYKGAREKWLKLSSCPFCDAKDSLALRRHSGVGANALGHFCTTPAAQCSWNARFEKPTPLPFYIVDEDIYDLAPSVLLGTVDKLAALGQSQGTIRRFFGMFWFAPFMKIPSNRLYVPFKSNDWDGYPGPTSRKLFPSYDEGEKLFFDPFPALLIQDEAHLLDESLGTFSGLFESALGAAFDELAPRLRGQLAYEPDSTVRRKVKVIAASATVSEPQRQMRNLYQRESTVQFPFPGPSLYSSFYAEPKQPDPTADDTERCKLSAEDIELRSHWARVYTSVLTNGHRHTVAMASVLGHFHLIITGLYEKLRSEDPAQEQLARAELVKWVSKGPLGTQFERLLASADSATLLTLLDLHRISLTYVTNKKGGDQVIDTEKMQFEKLHKEAGIEGQALMADLISGAVSAAEIQDIVRRAETRVAPGQPFPNLNDTLRSVIATAAISHGVDVEEFNAMFFAGIPSDVAEYIQASSRIGRTHVGFSLLVPVPQRYRDRFVLEIHDVFHRFLERMILPAAIDRWAEKALVRVMPSFFQEYVCGVSAIGQLCDAEYERKRYTTNYRMADDAKTFLSDPSNLRATESFMAKALGLAFSPSPDGAAYYRALLKNQLALYRRNFDVERLVSMTQLTRFFEGVDSMLRPMTSLRDVDQPGTIHESKLDASNRRSPEGATARAMRFIRRGSGADFDATDRRTEAPEH
jgi:hypothetical protein